MTTIVEVHVNISLCNNWPNIDNFKKRRIYLTRQCQDKKCTVKPETTHQREKSLLIQLVSLWRSKLIWKNGSYQRS